MHLFTYGTLQFPKVWQAVVGRAAASQQVTAKGYAIYRVKDRLYPGMISETDSQVRGRLYSEIDDNQLLTLDRFEGAEYYRTRITVTTESGTLLECFAYLASAETQLASDSWDRDYFVQSGGIEKFLTRTS